MRKAGLSIKERFQKAAAYLKDRFQKAGSFIKERGQKTLEYFRGILGKIKELPRKYLIWGAIGLILIVGLIYVLMTALQIINPDSLTLGNPLSPRKNTASIRSSETYGQHRPAGI